MTDRRKRPSSGRTLAGAIERNEWERVSLYLLLGVARALRSAPPGEIEDLIALLADEAVDER
jgi:hypothetical protein